MHVLIAIALKSLLVAGVTLGALKLMQGRSAAERSWVAHIGLLALVVMAFAPLVLPAWNVEAPAITAPADDKAPVVEHEPATLTVAQTAPKTTAQPAVARAIALPSLSPAAATTALYAVPAAILLLLTALALARLIALRARAEVLVDGHWLSALARAQKRMGFKHGTALLTSDELASPISWGLMRPVILLNSRAVEAASEAEAIIAHELAHVARLDWLKLLLARVSTALFWFNPLVWLLAREAHQLREETADDTVLGADIVDTDYAQLLVGVARHECPGLLLGAHGVAPSKSSLARRVARVLDGKSVRGPVARSFALGVFVGAIVVAAPLAALTFVPPTAPRPFTSPNSVKAIAPAAAPEVPADLPRLIASGVSTSVSTAVAAAVAIAPNAPRGEMKVVAPSGATVEQKGGVLFARAPSGATSTIYPPDASGRRKVVAVAPNGAVAVSYDDGDDVPDTLSRAQRAAERHAAAMRATGVTPEYVGGMRAVAPQFARLSPSEFAGMRAVGVTPDYARSLIAAGFPSITSDQMVEARAIGLTGDYVRAMRSAGLRGSLDDFVQLRAVGIDPAFAARAKASGATIRDADDLVELRALGRVVPPVPPHVPARGWNPLADPGG